MVEYINELFHTDDNTYELVFVKNTGRKKEFEW